MKTRAQNLAAALFATATLVAQAAKPQVTFESTALISPMPVVEERTAHSAKALGNYISQLRDAVFKELSAHSDLPGLRLAIVVAVKPQQLSRCWVEVGAPGIDVSISEALEAACLSVKPIEVSGGPIAFSLNFKIKRGGKSPNFQGLPYPLPAEWRDALEKSAEGRIPDDALSVVWP
jgi:hypothetical protein